MKHIRLFRKRYFPNEIVELKNDNILLHQENLLITQWDVLKPRHDFCKGFSAYYIDQGIKVSKMINEQNQLVYWYCDIIKTEFNAPENTYIFHDLLIDVLIYPDGHVEVVDLDELANILEQNILSHETIAYALRSTNILLSAVYAGNFSLYTDSLSRFCL